MPHVLALDEGTTSARTILFDERARSVAVDQIPVHSSFPRDGWVEQDPEQIWQAQMRSVQRAIEKAGVAPNAIAALGITNQRETTIVWDRKTGKPVSPAIVWQCRRTAGRCKKLVDEGHGGSITASTGLVVDAYFAGTKIGWILDNVPDARARAEAGELAFGTVDSWLIWKLTGGREHVIDRTNASRTLLMNLASGAWDEGMLALLGVPSAMLPRITPSSGVIAMTDASLFGAEIPIAGIAGDQQAALFGQACFRPGLSKNTYGTGCFLLLNTGEHRPVSQNKLLATAAAGAGEFALEGSIFIAGAAVQWLRDSLGLIETAAESEAVAASVPDTAGVYVVPAFVGLGAPHWSSSARGLITGLTRAAGKAQIVRATLESIAYQTRELVEAMQADSGEELAELRVDGGAAANDFLMQFQADILGKPVVRPANVETTALGAAFLAGLATGVWQSLEEIESFWAVDKRFEPQMAASRRDELFAGWQTAVELAIP
ncbi:MAG: glycerol kinase GlpK [Acidobacteria bacterium]|nr:glycerol kinase GlpK [Acidobacteriota bacterium]